MGKVGVLAGAGGVLAILAPLTVCPQAFAAAPACQSDQLNHSARLAGGEVTVSPAPGDLVATPQTQISFLGPSPSQLRYVNVTGSESGTHTGHLLPYSQGDGASFAPDTPFTAGETVNVKAQLLESGVPRGFGWRFVIATPAARRAPSTHRRPERASYLVQRFHSQPQLRPPVVTVTRHTGSMARGYLFMAPEQPPVQSGPMIFDNSGQLIWFLPQAPGGQAVNLRVQRYGDQPVITYWQHLQAPDGGWISRDVILDQHYRTVALVRAGNGLGTDTHALQLTGGGVALLTANEAAACDLERFGGPADGAVLVGVVQAIDVQSGLVRWQWSALDQIALSDAEVSARPTTSANPFDPYHLNSLDIGPDGTLLISARNTWAIYEVDRSSDRVLWQLGGRHSDFKLKDGPTTAFQHDARLLSGDQISVFNNGGAPPVQPQSTALVTQLNLKRRTASVVRRFTHSPPLRSGSQGDVQQLSGGRYLVGWGQEPYVSEYDHAGRLLFDAHLPSGEQSYRALRFRWDGTPAYPPTAVLSAQPNGQVTVWASWNGATRVLGWRVLEGAPTALQPSAERTRSGFETAISVPAPAEDEQVVVQALGTGGRILGTTTAVGAAAN